MADRYCSNCGQELGNEVRFCPNCGKSVVETGAVPTPEADVSVPPPPQQQAGGPGAAPNFAPTGAAPQAGGQRRNPLVVGCAVISGLFLLLTLLGMCGAVLGGSGGEEETTAPSQAAGNQKDQTAENQEDQKKADQASKPAPKPKPEPKPAPPPEPEPITLSGAGQQATEPFNLESGLTVVKMTHDGQANFIVDMLDEAGQPVAPMGVVNVIGPFEGSTAFPVSAGQHLLDIQADGNWNITVEQPRPTDAPATTNFSGSSSQATELFQLSGGLHTFRMTHQGKENFIVDLLDADGNPVAPMGLVNEIGPFDGSKATPVPDDGIYLLVVMADGPWTIDVQ